MIRFLFMLVVIALLVVAAYPNQEQMVSLRFFGGMETNPIRLYIIAAATFLIGLFFGVLFFFPGWIRSILARRKQSKRIEQLEIDLDRIRSASLKEHASPLSINIPKENEDPQ